MTTRLPETVLAVLIVLLPALALTSASCGSEAEHAHGPDTHTHAADETHAPDETHAEDEGHAHGEDTHTHEAMAADTAGTYVDTTGAFFDDEPAPEQDEDDGQHTHGDDTHTHN